MQKLTIDEFADRIRSSGNNAIIYQHLNNTQLAQEWLKEHSDDGRALLTDELNKLSLNNISNNSSLKKIDNNSQILLENKKKNSVSKPWYVPETSLIPDYDGDDGHYMLDQIGGITRNFLGKLQTGVTGTIKTEGGITEGWEMPDFKPLRASAMTIANLILNPNREYKARQALVLKYKSQLNDPNFKGNKEYIIKNALPIAEKELQESYEEIMNAENAGNDASLRRRLYEEWSLPVTKALNMQYMDWMDQYFIDNPKYAKIAKWTENEKIDSFSDWMNPSIWGTAFSDFGVSMLGSGGYGLTLKTVQKGAKITKLNKTAKMINKIEKSTAPVVGVAVLTLMESQDVQQESMRFLMEEYEWVDSNGVTRIGIPAEDALEISAQAGLVYGMISAMIERAQMNRMTDFLGVTQNTRRSLLHHLSSQAYTSVPKSRTGRLVYEGWDFLGIQTQESWTEGVQAWMAEVTKGAIEQGYDINQGPGLQALFEDMGVEAHEIGFGSLILPWFSDNPEIAQSARRGFAGSGPIAGVSVSRHTSGLKIDGDKAKFQAAAADGDDVVSTKIDGGVILHNVNNDETMVIPTGNDLESDHVVNQMNQDLAGDNQVIKIKKSIKTADDYLTSIVNNILDRPGFTNNEIITNDKESWTNEGQLNPVQKQFLKDAKANRGAESDDWEKIVSLIELTGDKDLLNRVINDRSYTEQERENLLAIKHLVVQSIKENAAKNLNKQFVESDQISDLDAKAQLESLLSNREFMTDDAILEHFAAGSNILEQMIAEQVNSNDYDDVNIAFKEDFFENLNPTEVTQDDIKQSLLDASNEDLQEALSNDNAENREIDKINRILNKSKIVDFKSKNLSGEALYGYAGSVYIDAQDADMNPIQAVKIALEDKLDATNIKRLALELGIKVGKDAGTPKGKKKYIDMIANKINENIKGESNTNIQSAPSAPATFTIETPVSKMEKDIIAEEREETDEVTKADRKEEVRKKQKELMPILQDPNYKAPEERAEALIELNATLEQALKDGVITQKSYDNAMEKLEPFQMTERQIEVAMEQKAEKDIYKNLDKAKEKFEKEADRVKDETGETWRDTKDVKLIEAKIEYEEASIAVEELELQKKRDNLDKTSEKRKQEIVEGEITYEEYAQREIDTAQNKIDLMKQEVSNLKARLTKLATPRAAQERQPKPKGPLVNILSAEKDRGFGARSYATTIAEKLFEDIQNFPKDSEHYRLMNDYVNELRVIIKNKGFDLDLAKKLRASEEILNSPWKVDKWGDEKFREFRDYQRMIEKEKGNETTPFESKKFQDLFQEIPAKALDEAEQDIVDNEPSIEDVQAFFKEKQPELDPGNRDQSEKSDVSFQINEKKSDDLADGLEEDIECG